MSTKITLTGWRAVAALVVVVGFIGFRYVTARKALDADGRQVLEEWIALEFQRHLLADTALSLEERGQAVLGAGNVTIRSMSARGTLARTVVKVELEPSEGLPSGTELVRYYRMSYSRITGWVHRGTASVVSYHLALF